MFTGGEGRTDVVPCRAAHRVLGIQALRERVTSGVFARYLGLSVLEDPPQQAPRTLRAALAAPRAEGKPVCVAGGRHAMGGQQFAGDAVLLDIRPMRRIVGLDAEHGIVEAEAGIQWPELIERLIAMQRDQPAAWGIIQKQTGADRLTLGGALGANIHGRGLALKVTGGTGPLTVLVNGAPLPAAAGRRTLFFEPGGPASCGPL